MSDFLTNLAARALAAPSLRPRTRSRFEPASSESVEVEGAPLPASRQRRVIAVAPATEQDDIVADADVLPSPRGRRPWRDAGESAIEPQQSPDRIEHEVSRTVATREHHLERVIEKHETTIRVRSQSTVPATAESRRDGKPRHRHDEQQPRIERERIAERAPSAFAERRPNARQPRTKTPAAPEPVIHVSIGRVEVRAVPSTPAPHRARARTAPMTIEEYAAKKAKGRP